MLFITGHSGVRRIVSRGGVGMRKRNTIEIIFTSLEVILYGLPLLLCHRQGTAARFDPRMGSVENKTLGTAGLIHSTRIGTATNRFSAVCSEIVLIFVLRLRVSKNIKLSEQKKTGIEST